MIWFLGDESSIQILRGNGGQKRLVAWNSLYRQLRILLPFGYRLVLILPWRPCSCCGHARKLHRGACEWASGELRCHCPELHHMSFAAGLTGALPGRTPRGGV